MLLSTTFIFMLKPKSGLTTPLLIRVLGQMIGSVQLQYKVMGKLLLVEFLPPTMV